MASIVEPGGGGSSRSPQPQPSAQAAKNAAAVTTIENRGGAAGTLANPSFDQRLFFTHPMIVRGFMQHQLDAPVPGGPQNRCKLNFLFNPNNINIQYNPNNDLTRPAFQNAVQQSSFIKWPGQKTLSFDLLFDRTYELNAGTQPRGVLADTQQFERMLGIMAGNPVPLYLPIDFFFGGSQSVFFKFSGVITGSQISYTHFSSRMVPMRCGISITAQEILTQNAATLQTDDGTTNTGGGN